jgi:hypothetical protein
MNGQPHPTPATARVSARVVSVLGLVLAASAVWAGASAATPRHAAGCTPGVKQVKGEYVRVFCGRARATVKAAGKIYHFRNGLCQKTPGTGLGEFAVNIGTVELPTPLKPKFSHFGVALEKAKGGTYQNQAVGIVVPGRNLSPLVNKVVVSNNLKKGSFTGTATMSVKGTLVPKKIAVSGSWTC